MNAVDPMLAAAKPPFKLGSEEHKHAFCRMLLDTFDPYKPAVIDWPKLESEALQRVVTMPFWTIAVETEDSASAHFVNFAKMQTDPLLKEAFELIAFEENRHRHVLDALVKAYGITLKPLPKYVPSRRTEWNMMSTGYGECLDSFFAFGLFELAKRSGYFPMELVDTFEPVIREENRHIVFFINWVVYTQAQKPFFLKPWFMAKRLSHLFLNGMSRLGVMDGDQDDFATTGKDSVGIDIELAQFMDLCLSENDRRMATLDARLVRPKLMPTFVKTARLFIR